MNTEAYLRIQYRDKARSETEGDCWQLVWLIYRDELGIRLPTHDTVSLHTTDIDALSDYIDTRLSDDFEPVDAVQAYDLIVLYQGIHPTHIACAVDDTDMIHLLAGRNVAIEPIFGRRWGNRIYRIYRHKARL